MKPVFMASNVLVMAILHNKTLVNSISRRVLTVYSSVLSFRLSVAVCVRPDSCRRLHNFVPLYNFEEETT